MAMEKATEHQRYGENQEDLPGGSSEMSFDAEEEEDEEEDDVEVRGIV